MIKNQWYAVLDSKQVTKKPAGFIRMSERLVFWRDDSGKIVCMKDKCAHRGASLAIGRIVHNHIECPFHGLEYDNTGKCACIPANGMNAPVPENFKVGTYLTHEAYGFIFIWWGDNPPANVQPPQFFDDLGNLPYTTALDPWKAHYSRIIENQLDVVHLPFVHYNTIGRGCKTLVDGPKVEWVNENKFYMYVHNRSDDGAKPLKPEEMKGDKYFKLEFIYPNLWQNYITDKMRIVAAFVPVDENNSILTLHIFQGFVKVPGIKQIVDSINRSFSLKVAHQDRRVVETQVPKPSGLMIGENLFQGDNPILEYRKRRAELIKLAGMETV
jgi:phenylpropionate dioxygenase-like ring-hydroxylating dioxygenase large terminal subunit